MRILAVDTSTQYAFLVLCVYHAQWNTEKWTCVKIDRDKDNWLECFVKKSRRVCLRLWPRIVYRPQN
jgi:hypothetical protein